MLKTLAILSITAVKRSAVEQEGPKPYWRLEKKISFFETNDKNNLYKFQGKTGFSMECFRAYYFAIF